MAKNISTVTRKGQITIPIEMRRALGIQEGDKVEFISSTQGMSILPLPTAASSENESSPVQKGLLSRYAKHHFANDQERIQAEKTAAELAWSEREYRSTTEPQMRRIAENE